MSNQRFTGVLAPVVTPFAADLRPDLLRLQRHCEWLESRGAGLAIFGTNSEANSLSTEEKCELLEGLIGAGVNPDSLMPGTGSCSLIDAVRLTSTAVCLGCSGVLMLPPFYYKNVSDEGLYRFYAEVIQRIGDNRLQIYLYHIPPVSNVPLSLSLVERLVHDFPQTIAGIKDSSGDWQNTLALLQAGLEDFRVFCGSESFLLQTMRHGGAGCISATANVNPAGLRGLYEHYTDPDADQRQSDLDQLRRIYQGLPMIPALKSTLAQFHHDQEWQRVRPPLVALTADQNRLLASQLAAIGFNL